MAGSVRRGPQTPRRACWAPTSAFRVRAIGSALRLKQRFGSGYQVSVSVLPVRASGPATAEVAAAMAVNAAAIKQLFKVRGGK